LDQRCAQLPVGHPQQVEAKQPQQQHGLSGITLELTAMKARRGNVYGHYSRAQALTIAFILSRGAPGQRE
jgi:hypothetical protein